VVAVADACLELVLVELRSNLAFGAATTLVSSACVTSTTDILVFHSSANACSASFGLGGGPIAMTGSASFFDGDSGRPALTGGALGGANKGDARGAAGAVATGDIDMDEADAEG
jgi:hypothetical protein